MNMKANRPKSTPAARAEQPKKAAAVPADAPAAGGTKQASPQRTARRARTDPGRLALLYLLVVGLRFLVGLAVSSYPLVNIDEFLYYGLARSLANGQGLLFRGQPADYGYILYPLTLVPVYWTGIEGPALYRVLQLWNIAMSSLSLFPLAALARRLTGRRKAVGLAALCMLLPDFLIGPLMMAENLILPLFFTLWAVACRFAGIGTEEEAGSRAGRLSDALLMGLIGGLMGAAKPGDLAPAAVLALAGLVSGLRARKSRHALYAAAGAGVTAAVFAFFHLLVGLLGGTPSLLSLYDSQVTETTHTDVFLTFLGVYPAYFMLAGGVAPAVLVFARGREYTPAQKAVLRCMIAALAVTMAGVAWTVNRHEYSGNTAHMRYLGMYLPLLLLWLHAEGSAPERKASRGGFPVAAAALAAAVPVLLILLGGYAGVNDHKVLAENMTLAALMKALRSGLPGVCVIVLALGFSAAAVGLLRLKDREKARRIATTVLCGWMVLNGVCTCLIWAEDSPPGSAADTRELLSQGRAENPLHVWDQNTVTSYYAAYDVYSRSGISQTDMTGLFNRMYATGGVYRPFVPDSQRGNKASLPTPETDTLLLDADVWRMVKLSANTEHRTAGGNGLHAVRIPDPDLPWLDCIIGGTAGGRISPGEKAVVLVFGDDFRRNPVTFTLNVQCARETTLSFYSSRERRQVQLSPGAQTCTVAFSQSADAWNIEADQELRIDSYSLSAP